MGGWVGWVEKKKVLYSLRMKEWMKGRGKWVKRWVGGTSYLSLAEDGLGDLELVAVLVAPPVLHFVGAQALALFLQVGVELGCL